MTGSSSSQGPEVGSLSGSSSSGPMLEVRSLSGSSSSQVPELGSLSGFSSSQPVSQAQVSPLKDPSSTRTEREDVGLETQAETNPMEVSGNDINVEEDVKGQVEALKLNWRSKKEQSMTESDEEVKENFESIKSRLRPRYPVNYSQVSARKPPVTPSRGTRTPKKVGEIKHDSVKRKLNEESRQVTFLLPANKRRRRVSEHQSRQGGRGEDQPATGRSQRVQRRSRRKSESGHSAR